MIKSMSADVDASHDHSICLKLSGGQAVMSNEQVVPKACKILVYARKTEECGDMLSLLQDLILYIN